MWKVYKCETITDAKYGTRTVEIEQCEGSLEFCEKYVALHPDTYVAWYCIQSKTQPAPEVTSAERTLQ